MQRQAAQVIVVLESRDGNQDNESTCTQKNKDVSINSTYNTVGPVM